MKNAILWMATLTIFAGAMLHAQGKDISGNWQGTLQLGKGMRIVVKIINDDGKLKATLYNLEMGGYPVPVNTIALQGVSLKYTATALDLSYAGTLSADGSLIGGSQTQGGQTFVLNFTRVSEANTWEIPKQMAPDAKPKLEVATIKPSEQGRPGKFMIFRGRHLLSGNYNMNDLIGFAYGLHPKQIIGAPEWFGSALYDIDGLPDVAGQPSAEQMKGMVQNLLTERFKLVFHRETREIAVYALTLAKADQKLFRSAPDRTALPTFTFKGLGKLMVQNETMADFASSMSSFVMDKPVVDQTGLTVRYDFALNWTPDESQFGGLAGHAAAVSHTDDPNAPPGLYTAIREQLGLKLEPVKAPDDVIVIDHAEAPSAN